ncbi:hypothetical protein ACQEU6_19325 [Spirillospora sp. CA-108201]
MNGLSERELRLAALGARLSARGYEIDLTRTGLKVAHPNDSGCCGGRIGDKIGCRKRREDGHRLWFFTSWGAPLAPAHDVVDAVVQIQGYIPSPNG